MKLYIWITHPSFCISGPGVSSRLSQERVKEHRLSHGHVGPERVVPAHIGHAILQPGRADGDSVEQDVAVQSVLPRVVAVGQDLAKRRALRLWKNKPPPYKAVVSAERENGQGLPNRDRLSAWQSSRLEFSSSLT